jgi:hypothetical protein
MTSDDRSGGAVRYGRRGFLARLGLGAGALALGGSAADAFARPVDVPQARSGFVSTDAQHFGRLFGDLPPFATANQGVTRALTALGAQGGLLDAKDDLSAGPVRLITDPALSANNPDNPTHTAGTTFLGQFIDHDVTFDTSSPLGTPTDPLTSPTGRTPALDLDSVYGAGPTGSPMLYDTANDPAKLLIESGGLFEDLPRLADGTAIIADPRNDEHVIIAGLHCAFILFHKPCGRLRARERRGHVARGVRTGTEVDDLALPLARPARVPAAGNRPGDGRRRPRQRPQRLHSRPGRGVHARRVSGRLLPLRAQHGPALVPGEPQGRQRQRLFRVHLRPWPERRHVRSH